MSMDMTISASDSPPPERTPPIIRQGTPIMPPAQTAALDSPLWRWLACPSNPLCFSLMVSYILIQYIPAEAPSPQGCFAV